MPKGIPNPKNLPRPDDIVTLDGWGNQTLVRDLPDGVILWGKKRPMICLLHTDDLHQTYIDPVFARLLKPLIDKLAAG